MQLTTKLNVGDNIWHISRADGCISEIEVTEIHVQVVRNEPNPQVIVNYGTDEGYGVFEDDEGKTWWKTRDAILSHIMSTINDRAKVKTRPEPAKKSTLSEEFEKVFSEPADDSNWKKTGEFKVPKPEPQVGQCSCEDEDEFQPCPCGCQSRPTIEEEFDKFIKDAYPDLPKPPKTSLLTPEQHRIIEQEFDRIFGPENRRKVKENAKAGAKEVLSELNDLYEQIFGKEK